MLWWTIQNLIITSLLAGLVSLACRSGRIRPVGRHALWLVVLLKLLTPPLVAWPWAVRDPLSAMSQRATPASEPVVPIALPSLSPKPIPPVMIDDPAMLEDDSAIGAVTLVPTPERTPATQSAVSAPVVSIKSPPRDWLGLLLRCAGIVWLEGAIVFAVIHLAQILHMTLVVRRSRLADARLERLVGQIADRLGVGPVRTRVSRRIGSPLIWCLVRPAMLWPAALPAGMREESIRGLIIHELAHLKRRDHWVGWLELLAGCLWWWNPLFWYVRHQLRENAELACDAWVVQTLPKGRRAYAEGLLAVCECMSERASKRVFRSMAPMPALGVSTGGRRFLERRLAMILRDRIPLRLSRVGVFMIALLALCTLPAWSQKTTATAEDVQAAEMRRATAGMGGGWIGAGALGQPAAPLPDDAAQLIKRFEQQEAEARREIEMALAKQREQLIKQLRDLQDRYTKAGQLDEAVAIRDRVRQLEGGGMGTGGVTFTSIRAMPDPGNATGYRDRVGQSFLFDVTSGTSGSIWGTDIYTDDTAIATAAVHAGILPTGHRGVVRVTILPGQSSYEGSTRNGVTSLPYGPWEGSYRIEAAPNRLSYRTMVPAPDPGTLSTYRDKVGEHFVFQVTGSPEGTIWGDGVYTDDSPLAVAAVHAGAVEVGEQGIVDVTILPGREQYDGSTRNGVTSHPYGPFGGSYRIRRVESTLAPRRLHSYGFPNPGPRQLFQWLSLDEPSLEGYREKAAEARKEGKTFAVQRNVVGSTTGSVWGDEIYTDDSSIAAAAVHAGVLRDGEKGMVKITILPGRDSYGGSTRNGVTSQSYGSWGGSFRIERGTPPQDSRLKLDNLKTKWEDLRPKLDNSRLKLDDLKANLEVEKAREE